MPETNSSLINCEYLLNVALAKCFRIETSQIKVGQLFKKVQKTKLFQELEKICQEKRINLGFSLEKLPNKKWLFNVLHTLDENNEIFQKIIDHEKVIGLTRDDLNTLKDYDTCFGRKKNLKFFKRTQQQVNEKKTQLAKQKLSNFKSRLQRKRDESEKIEQKIRTYQHKINSLTQPQNNNKFKMLQCSKSNTNSDIYINILMNYAKCQQNYPKTLLIIFKNNHQHLL